ncbi:MAG: amidohydrolase family protein [Candidatus Dormiibacterota bacterium]
MKSIDVHVHPYTEEVLAVTPEWFWGHARKTFNFGGQPITVDDMVRTMDQSEVETSVLLAFDCETTHGWKVSNEVVANLVAQRPDRFIGFASVDPNKHQLAVIELEHAVRELGMRGLKLHPPTQHFYPNDRAHYPLWAKAQELGIPVLVHTGHNQSGGRLQYGDPTLLDEVALDFPDLKIILAHFGFPWVNQAISVVWIRRNCYLELSGWSPKYIPDTIWHYARSIFPDRVLFGTDAPVMTAARWLQDFGAIQLPDSVKHKILYQNAHRLLFEGAATPADAGDEPAAADVIPS